MKILNEIIILIADVVKRRILSASGIYKLFTTFITMKQHEPKAIIGEHSAL